MGKGIGDLKCLIKSVEEGLDVPPLGGKQAGRREESIEISRKKDEGRASFMEVGQKCGGQIGGSLNCCQTANGQH